MYIDQVELPFKARLGENKTNAKIRDIKHSATAIVGLTITI